MSKLWLIGLAASAAWTPAALAQGAPAPMAHGAQASGHGGMVRHGGGRHVRPPAMHGGGHMKGMKGMHRPMPQHGHMKGMKGMHRPMRPGHMTPGHMKGMKGFHRFGRGHIVPPHFRSKQFIVHDWRMFGFPAPMPGFHWIRFHDDALLIDRHGRVMDGRYGWDWDGRGGQMAYDDEYYEDDYGRDDYDRDDYGYDEEYAEEGDCRTSCTRVRHMPAPRHPGYGYGYGYGYGAGCACGPVVITETTTTTAPVVETHTYYETVTERRAAPRRYYSKPVVRHYSKPVRRSVKAAPRPGERG